MILMVVWNDENVAGEIGNSSATLEIVGYSYDAVGECVRYCGSLVMAVRELD